MRVNDSRNKHGEPQESRQTLDPTKCSTNPIAADDERLGQLQQSGVRLVGLREFFTQEPMSVDSKDEFLWDGKYYVAIQTADWGYYHSTLAALKEGQQDGNPNT
ncbi:MAG: hypothetical protein ISN29_01605 [Gammaproteobacteria bacterium AqS3]|nr:hypothetical protein [Gammaproteobacteria bacterium AqS3]